VATSVPEPLYEEGWEQQGKQIFVLSESGKPIFSRYGDEQDMAATMGLISALISGAHRVRHRACALRLVLSYASYIQHTNPSCCSSAPCYSGARSGGLPPVHQSGPAPHRVLRAKGPVLRIRL